MTDTPKPDKKVILDAQGNPILFTIPTMVLILLVVVCITTSIFVVIFMHDNGKLQAENTQLNKQVCTLKEDANVLKYSTCLSNSEKDNIHCYNATYTDIVTLEDFKLCPERATCISGFGERSKEYSGNCETKYVAYY